MNKLRHAAGYQSSRDAARLLCICSVGIAAPRHSSAAHSWTDVQNAWTPACNRCVHAGPSRLLLAACFVAAPRVAAETASGQLLWAVLSPNAASACNLHPDCCPPPRYNHTLRGVLMTPVGMRPMLSASLVGCPTRLSPKTWGQTLADPLLERGKLSACTAEKSFIADIVPCSDGSNCADCQYEA